MRGRGTDHSVSNRTSSAASVSFPRSLLCVTMYTYSAVAALTCSTVSIPTRRAHPPILTVGNWCRRNSAVFSKPATKRAGNASKSAVLNIPQKISPESAPHAVAAPLHTPSSTPGFAKRSSCERGSSWRPITNRVICCRN